MSQCSQQELQRQLFKLGWTIGQQKHENYASDEVIQMRLLSKVTPTDTQSPEDDAKQSVALDNKNESTKFEQLKNLKMK